MWIVLMQVNIGDLIQKFSVFLVIFANNFSAKNIWSPKLKEMVISNLALQILKKLEPVCSEI